MSWWILMGLLVGALVAAALELDTWTGILLGAALLLIGGELRAIWDKARGGG